MQRIAKVVLKNPVGLIACFAFLPLFLLYPGITMANLFLLMVLILAYYLFLSHEKTLRLSSPIILAISLVLYFFSARENLSYIFVALSLATVASLVYLAMSAGVSISQGRATKRLFVVGLSILILLPLTFKLSFALLLKNQVKRLSSSALQFDKSFAADNKQITNSLSDTVNDPFITDLLQKRSYSDLTEYCQNIMVAKDLDYLVVTDENDLVVARAHKPKAIGDDYSSIMPEIKENQAATGISYEAGRAFMASLSPLGAGSKPKIGSIIGGKFINESYLKKLQLPNSGVALFGQLSLATVSVNSANLTGFIEQVKDKSIPEEGKYQLNEYKDQNILLLDRLMPGGGGRLLLYEPINLLNRALLMNLVALLLLILIGCTLLGIKKTSRGVMSLYRNLTVQSNGSVGKQKILSLALEYLLFILIIGLVWWRSSVAYYSEGVSGDRITESQASSAITDVADLRLVADSYAKQGENFKAALQTDNLKESPSSVQVSIKYDIQYLSVAAIDGKDGACQKVYDKIIDTKQGTINFSCDLKNISTPGKSALPVAEFSFRALKAGVASLSIDPNYSYILTAHGKNNKTAQTFPTGENIIIK